MLDDLSQQSHIEQLCELGKLALKLAAEVSVAIEMASGCRQSERELHRDFSRHQGLSSDQPILRKQDDPTRSTGNRVIAQQPGNTSKIFVEGVCCTP